MSATLTPRERLIVALDVPDGVAALALLKRLAGEITTVKVGKQLFVAEGPALVRKLIEAKLRVFLDLKFHDIPNTVAGAVREAVRLGAAFVDVHAAGGRAMMRAACEAAEEEAARRGVARPRLLGVTVLTSLDAAALQETGVSGSVEEQVVRLAVLAQQAGLDGVVASPREIGAVRARCGREFLVVTPGIREAVAAPDDQRRTLTASEAIHAGADFLVVGRPVIGASDPGGAASKMAAQIGAALGSPTR